MKFNTDYLLLFNCNKIFFLQKEKRNVIVEVELVFGIEKSWMEGTWARALKEDFFFLWLL